VTLDSFSIRGLSATIAAAGALFLYEVNKDSGTIIFVILMCWPILFVVAAPLIAVLYGTALSLHNIYAGSAELLRKAIIACSIPFAVALLIQTFMALPARSACSLRASSDKPIVQDARCKH
jgi:hypothetical protein